MLYSVFELVFRNSKSKFLRDVDFGCGHKISKSAEKLNLDVKFDDAVLAV